MKAQPVPAPAGWRAAYALMIALYVESFSWLPRLVGWLFGAPVSLPPDWASSWGWACLSS